MRAKMVLSFIPMSLNYRLFYERITATRLTIFFFALALLHCILQVSFQSWAFAINNRAAELLNDIVITAGFSDQYALLIKDGGLRLCGPDDKDKDIYQCNMVWQGHRNDTSYTPPSNNSTTSTVPPVRVLPTSFISAPTGIPDDRKPDDDDDDRESSSSSNIPTPTRTIAIRPTLPLPTRSTTSAANDPGATIEIVEKRDLAQPEEQDGKLVGITIPSLRNGTGDEPVTITLACAEMIIWPNQIIHDTKREDVTFMAFQIWVLGMSTVAILNESIPHIIAALLTHLLATGWSVYQFFNTAAFREEFVRTTLKSGRCDGINLLPGYWQERNAAEIAVLTVNAISLCLSAFLSWRLIKSFGWQTFKRIGASLEINRVYMLVLIFSIGLQLAFFFVIAFMGLWLDILTNTPLGRRAAHIVMYKALAAITCVLMFPWLMFGWFAVRRESKLKISVFVLISALLLGGWGVLFVCRVFRWTFVDWRFFGVVATAASSLMLGTALLGIVCFLNFGKGLARFLNGQEPLPDENVTYEDDMAYDIEKRRNTVEFPASSPPSIYPAPPIIGGNYGAMSNTMKKVPLATIQEASPFEPPIDYPKIPPRSQQPVNPDLLRKGSDSSTHSSKSDPFSLDRSLSNGSQRSGAQLSRSGTKSSGSHSNRTNISKTASIDFNGNARRGWVIE